ncbi:hypothetical protein GGF46_003847 [Coemansia sp. RSA 552]|nr:hypothetical protein GGF46_003847 [Coemansia sp. RSA 552]
MDNEDASAPVAGSAQNWRRRRDQPAQMQSANDPLPQQSKPKPRPKAPRWKSKKKQQQQEAAPEAEAGPAEQGQPRNGAAAQGSSSAPKPQGHPKKWQSYNDYYSPAKVKAMLAGGSLVRGVVRVNPKSRDDAYVSLDETPSSQAVHSHPKLSKYDVGSGEDIYLCGDRMRNRAISGDVVAVRLLSEGEAGRVYKHSGRLVRDRMHQQRSTKSRTQQRTFANKLGAAFDAASSEQPPSTAPADASSEAGPGPRVPGLFGEVVAIIAHNAGRAFVGTLSKHPPASLVKHPEFARACGEDALWFMPLDNAIPRMLVDPAGMPVGRRDVWRKTHCAVRMTDWHPNEPYPRAVFEKAVGARGPIETETQLLLEENNVCTAPFSADVLRCLPGTPWKIPQRDEMCRTDMRSECIFTIDPPTARDLDDAVSCRPLPNGNMLVGVHIADVSYFVRPNTALDAEAQRRATTTYMVQRAYPMLPSVLCEDLCSLNPGVDRLAFSVMWEMDPATATVHSTWFGRTIINSACKLSYDDAQGVIDGGHIPQSVSCFEHAQGATVHASSARKGSIEASILWFYHLSALMRKCRFDEGALSLNRVRLSFQLDESGAPVGCAPYAIKDSNRLIEEFMLLANMSVAARIEACFPDAALLRRHSPPLQRRLDEACEQLGRVGVSINPESAGSIAHAISSISDPDIRFTVEEMLIAPMQRAAYFSTHTIADQAGYAHYALNVPLYTHFTSPIRRYADVVVHRILEASLAVFGNHVHRHHALLPRHFSPYFPTTPPSGSMTTDKKKAKALLVPSPKHMAEIAHQCNMRKDAAKKAQEASLDLFLANYLAGMYQSVSTPGIITHGVVTKIKEDAFTFTTPLFGINGTIFIDRLAYGKSQVVSIDGRAWRPRLWSATSGTLRIVWDVKKPRAAKAGGSVDQLADSLSALVVDNTRHGIQDFPRSAIAEQVNQELRVFDKIAICIVAEKNPPGLSTKLAMPFT